MEVIISRVLKDSYYITPIYIDTIKTLDTLHFDCEIQSDTCHSMSAMDWNSLDKLNIGYKYVYIDACYVSVILYKVSNAYFFCNL